MSYMDFPSRMFDGVCRPPGLDSSTSATGRVGRRGGSGCRQVAMEKKRGAYLVRRGRPSRAPGSRQGRGQAHRGCSGNSRPGRCSAVRDPVRGRLDRGRSWLCAARQSRWQSGGGRGRKVVASLEKQDSRRESLLLACCPLACDSAMLLLQPHPRPGDPAAAEQRPGIGGSRDRKSVV